MNPSYLDNPYCIPGRLLYHYYGNDVDLDNVANLIEILHNADEHTIQQTLIKCAANNKLVTLIQIINEFDIDVQFNNNILIELAAYYNQEDIIKYLIHSNVDINIDHGKIINIYCSLLVVLHISWIF
jgi:sulfite reductase alpha subunit-like flavoprotein